LTTILKDKNYFLIIVIIVLKQTKVVRKTVNRWIQL